MNKNYILNEVFSTDGIAESVTDSLNIVYAKGVDIEKLKGEEKTPMFLTVEVMHVGMSRNGVNYTEADVRKVYQQLLEKKPNGYDGHIALKDDLVRPDAKAIWVGAALTEINGVLTLFGKCYILSDKKFRTYVKKAISIGKNIPVSIFASAKKTYNSAKGYFTLNLESLSLESIDFVREFSEGIQSLTGKANLATESISINENNMDYTEIKLNKLVKERPDLVEAIQKSVVVESVQNNDEVEKLTESINAKTSEVEALTEQVKTNKIANLKYVIESKVENLVRNKQVVDVIKTNVVRNLKEKIAESFETLNADNVAELVVEQMQQPAIVAILKSTKSVSVPAVAKAESVTESNRTIKIV